MYAAGLTAREIADRCRQNVATIHAHFQSRERYEPGTRATHEAALAARGVDRPTVSWRKLLVEVLEFQKSHGRLPSYDGDDTERRLHRWVLKQRRAYRNNSMSIPKTVLLEGVACEKVKYPTLSFRCASLPPVFAGLDPVGAWPGVIAGEGDKFPSQRREGPKTDQGHGVAIQIREGYGIPRARPFAWARTAVKMRITSKLSTAAWR